jgi:signal transduction histidine kinase
LRATVREEPTSSKKKKKTALVDGEIIGRALRHLGPWEMKFYWFNRGRIQRENSTYYQGALKPFLLQWAGGFMVFRDGFRVYPYGDRSNDWLDLDRKALAAGAYKLNRAQMVGYLRISSIANPLLQDQTNREGFRDSYDKEALRRLLRYVILGFCRPFLEEIDRKVAPAMEDMVVAVEKQIGDSKETAIASLKGIQARVPQEADSVGKVMHHLQEVSDAWERAKLRIAHFEEEIETYVHLAGVGLMLEFIAHELARITQDTLKAVTAGKYSPDIVEAQLKTLDKRVRILDELSVPGRQIRKDVSLIDLTEMLREFHESKSQREGISVEVIRKKPNANFIERVEKGQFLQILDNLFSNSFYWLVNRFNASEPGKIKIELDSANRQIRFTDNGPGIPEDRAEAIFQQFMTTKPPKEGRGLGLYIARRLAEENNASLRLAPSDSDGMHRTFVLSFGQEK